MRKLLLVFCVLFAGLTAIVTHSIGANTFIIVRIMEPFWFMTGIIATLPTLVAKQAPQME